MGRPASISTLLLIWMMIVAGRKCVCALVRPLDVFDRYTLVKKSVLQVRLIAPVNCSHTVFTYVFVEHPFLSGYHMHMCICDIHASTATWSISPRLGLTASGWNAALAVWSPSSLGAVSRRSSSLLPL